MVSHGISRTRYPTRQDQRQYFEQYPDYSAYSGPQSYQDQRPYSLATDVNQVASLSQGWTKTRYNWYPKKKSFGRNNRPRKFIKPECTERAQLVCTVFNAPMEEIYKQNPHLFPQQRKKPPYASTHHQSGTHNTEDCQTLRDVTEQLHRDEKLDRYTGQTP